MEPTTPFRAVPPLDCPVCQGAQLGAGPLHHCQKCRGTWIEEQTLADRVGSMRDERPTSIDWEPTDSPMRPCAACGVPMDGFLLYDVPVDRCAPHGVWFDKGELATVLERGVGPAPKPAAVGEPATAGAGIAGDVALGTVEVAAAGIDVIGGVAEVGSVVVEGVLDVLGAIFSAIDV